jgi:hypothetical protein
VIRGTVVRSQYRNLALGTVRTGPTGHGESLTDVESYLLPLDRARGQAFLGWGVAEGLELRCSVGSPGLTVRPGTAVDASGRLIVLSAGGMGVIDQQVDPAAVLDVPMVPVTDDGVVLPTTSRAGDLVVALAWREVQDPGAPDDAPTLTHAPWLRMLPAAGFEDIGEVVVLAKAGIDADGNVSSLSNGARRPVGIVAGRLQLTASAQAPQPAGGSTLGQSAVGEVSADGSGMHLSVLVGQARRTALTIDAATADVRVAGGLTASSVRVASAGGKAFATAAAADGSWRLRDDMAASDRLVVEASGRLGIGIPAGTAQRSVHVEGLGIHTGGGLGGDTGGYSFAALDVGRFVAAPQNGERWVWWATRGSARLWSGSDHISVSAKGEGGGLDVARRMRVRQGGDASAGIWFHQVVPNADRAFVGMASDDHVGFFGTGGGWGLRMHTTSNEVLFGGDFGRADGPTTASLFGSRIGDRGGGVLFLRSGGGVVAFDGDDRVGINTREPRYALHVDGRGGGGVLGTGAPGVWGVGTGSGLGGVFWGGVQIIGDLDVRGSVLKGGGGFRIDHPVDPETKYLNHSFVESPERATLYTGTAVTGEDGRVQVALPDYFDALNADARVQLTVVGGPARAAVEEPVSAGRFTIASDTGGVSVNWLVTAVRRDAWALANPFHAESDKAEDEKSLFLHAAEHGQPDDKTLPGAIRDELAGHLRPRSARGVADDRRLRAADTTQPPTTHTNGLRRSHGSTRRGASRPSRAAPPGVPNRRGPAA